MAADDQGAPLFEAEGITKKFGDFAANADVDLTIRPGERHALLGENGAGKSTLVKMMYGVMQPTAGVFRWRGKPMTVRRPADARALGIGMVFQHFSVFDALTVAENIALALPRTQTRGLAERVEALSQRYGLAIDPRRAVHTLSVGEKQRVEIIRCLLQDPRLLIMDEPTSVLTPQEADQLFVTLRALSGDGCAVLYISHKLEEVRALCTSSTILRHGRVVAECDPRETPARQIAEMMVGDQIAWVERDETGDVSAVPRLVLSSLDAPAETEFGVPLDAINLAVHEGEVLGIAGIAGEGQTELMSVLTGERRVEARQIEIDGHPSGELGPTERRLAGAAFVPEERNGHAAVATLTLRDNIVLSHAAAEGLAPRGWIDWQAALSWAKRVREAFDVRAADPNPVASSLSGGNLQKFVVGREILRDPAVLIVCQPTWGVDAGAASVIRRALISLAQSGSAVLIISQDLEEIFSMCDTVAVIQGGRLSEPEPVAAMTAAKIGLLMAGAGSASTLDAVS